MGCAAPFLAVTVLIDQPMQEQVGYFTLNPGHKARDISIYMTEGGRHE